MRVINFLRAFFELGIIAWWVIGGILLILGFAIVFFGMQSLDVIQTSIGFIILLIGVLLVYHGTDIKNIEVD